MTTGRKWMRAAAMAAGVALIAGCSGLLPPVAVDDLFGLDGTVVELTAVGSSALAEPVLAFSGTVNVNVTSDGFDVPGIVSAAKLEETVVFSGTVQVVVPGDVAADLPATFALTGGSLVLTVREGATTLGTAAGSASFAAPLTFGKGTCSFDLADTTCAYEATVNAAAHGITVTATASSAKAVFDALRDGKTLTVTGTVAATLQAPGLTADATILVTLGTQDGAITF